MYSYAPLGVSYASPLATSIARPVPGRRLLNNWLVGYAAPVSYV